MLHDLEGSPSAQMLEPLVWALRIDAGEEVSVAIEIEEVARDIVAMIRQRREEAATGSDGEARLAASEEAVHREGDQVRDETS